MSTPAHCCCLEKAADQQIAEVVVFVQTRFHAWNKGTKDPTPITISPEESLACIVVVRMVQIFSKQYASIC
jgi:hypothetical protein